MTGAAFKKAAEAAFRQANPGAEARIVWTRKPVSVRWADGTTGYSGAFSVEADGYRPRSMSATSLDGRVIVR